MSLETAGRVKPTTGPEPGESAEDAEEVTPETASMGDVEEFPAAVRKVRPRELDGILAGKFFDSSSGRLQFGSHPSNQAQIRDRNVSRFHCEASVKIHLRMSSRTNSIPRTFRYSLLATLALF